MKNPSNPNIPVLKSAAVEQHFRDPTRPFNPHPDWADALGIPPDTTYGVCTRRVPPEIGAKILAYHNPVNRAFNTDKAKALRDAVASGSYRSDNPVGLEFDWNWHLMNGQKRLGSVVDSGVAIIVRIEYGLAPDLISLTDGGEERARHDRVRLHPDQKINKLFSRLIPCLYRVKNGNQSALGENVYRKLFEEHKPGLLWIAELARSRGRAYIYSVPVLLALAEYYNRHPKLAQQFAHSFYRIGDYQKVPEADEFYRWATGGRGEGKHGRKQKVSDQLKAYRRAIAYMKSHRDKTPIHAKSACLWDDALEASTQQEVRVDPPVHLVMYREPILSACDLLKRVQAGNSEPLLPRYESEFVTAARNASAISREFVPSLPVAVFTAFLFKHPDALELLLTGEFSAKVADLHQRLFANYGSMRSPNVRSVYFTQLEALWRDTCPVTVERSQSERLSLSDVFKGRKPAAFVFDEQVYSVTDWIGVYERVCRLLLRQDPKLFAQLPDLPCAVSRRNCPYFSYEAADLRLPHLIADKGVKVYLERNLSADSIRVNLVNLFQAFEVPVSALEVLVKPVEQVGQTDFAD